MTSAERLNPTAAFDSLYLVAQLQAHSAARVSVPEIHLFAYLSCLLWLVDRRPVADWGYDFAGTELGAPFSSALEAAVTELVRRGHMSRSGEGVGLSENAGVILEDFTRLQMHRDRVECLSAACMTTAVLTPGIVGSALANEPELQRARAVPLNRSLLAESGLHRLYGHFEVLRREQDDEAPDLRVSAIAWLIALYRTGSDDKDL